MYFLSCFMVLLRQLRRLYIGGFIFQVPLVYNYSTWCTNAYLRVRAPTTYVLTHQGGGASVYRLRSLHQ
jgi:hypothetical protein